MGRAEEDSQARWESKPVTRTLLKFKQTENNYKFIKKIINVFQLYIEKSIAHTDHYFHELLISQWLVVTGKYYPKYL